MAEPDPCLSSRTVDGEGNLTLVVLTSRASLWELAALVAADPTADAIAEAVTALEAGEFKARGHRELLVSRLSDTQAAIDADRSAIAVRQLATMRKHLDGCGSQADKDDWILGCATQIEIRSLVDELIVALGG